MFATVEEAIQDVRAGRMVVVVDDEDRENEGDLTLAAEFCTPEAVNFMAKFGRGLICLTLTEERADYLRLGPMTAENTSRFGTAFTESIEAREGVTTGISAQDRAHTIQVAISPASTANDLARPGHIFPLRARKGGVLVRAGQTEASVDLARMAGLVPAGVICEIMNDDGTMARVADLVAFCAEHNLKMVTVADLIRYRLQHERYIHRVAEGLMPTPYGDFRMIAYESEVEGGESHIALVFGDIEKSTEIGSIGGAAATRTGVTQTQTGTADTRKATASSSTPGRTDAPGISDTVLVRVHTHCLAGDVFGSSLCDCRSIVDGSLRMIAEAGRGALIYLHNGTKGFSIDSALTPARLCLHHANRTRTTTRETPSAGEAPPIPNKSDERTQRTLRAVGLGGQILSDLGIHRIRLLSNTVMHVPALQGFGIEIVDQIPVTLTHTPTTPQAKQPPETQSALLTRSSHGLLTKAKTGNIVTPAMVKEHAEDDLA